MLDAQWLSLGRHTAVDCPEYLLELEECRKGEDQMMFLHLTVRKPWSREMLTRLLHTWAVLRKHVTCPIYAHGDNDDDKFEKFTRLFGLTHLVTLPTTNGATKRIFWHPGNDPKHQDHKFVNRLRDE